MIVPKQTAIIWYSRTKEAVSRRISSGHLYDSTLLAH